jgi:sugar lactone lactonase YvrE
MNGGLVCNLRDGIGLRDPDDRLTWLVYWQRDGLRGGLAAIDPAGRLLATTVRDDGSAGGQLIRVQPDGRATVILDGLGAGTGIGWNEDADRLYIADSWTRRVDVLDYDVTTGGLDARRPLCTITDGRPAGLCVDAEDGIWVAVDGVGRIHRYTKEGDLDRTLPVPADHVTGCCFGGPDFTDLYVTANVSPAGALFVAHNAGAGLPSPRFPR